MIWLTWRQFRVQLLVVGAVIAAAAVTMAITGPGLADAARRFGSSFLENLGYQPLQLELYRLGIVLLSAVPPVIGAFWGAPLVARELETGTHRLVWSQSVSRLRWLLVKVGLTGLATVAATGLLSLAVTWWAAPIDTAINAGQESNDLMPRLVPDVFASRGVVPVAYAAFAFALGVAVGLVLRRTVVAIAITLAAVIGVQLVTPLLLRPHLINPVAETITLSPDKLRGFRIDGPGPNPKVLGMTAAAGRPGDWMLGNETIDKTGATVSLFPQWAIDCGPGEPPGQAGARKITSAQCFDKLTAEGYRQKLTYVPANRFWDLQWREAGLFTALSLALLGFSFWRIRRDFS